MITPNHSLLSAKRLLAEQQIGHARAELLQLSQLASGDDAFEAELALCLIQAGLLEAARSRSDHAIAINPNHPAHRYARGLLELESIALETAAENFERCLQSAPQHWHAWILLGQTAHSLGRHAHAEHCFQSAKRIDPSNAFPDVSLATLYLDEEDFTAALRHSEIAIAGWPKMARTWSVHASALRGLRRFDEALQAGEYACSLSPADPEVRRSLGLTLQAMSRLTEAADHFRVAMMQRHAPDATIDPRAREFRQTSHAKLRHDVEQFDYLHALTGEDRFTALAETHRELLVELNVGADDRSFIDLDARQLTHISGRYNRLHHLAEPAALPGGALNPELDFPAIEADYRARGPGIGWIDRLLRPEALSALRHYCLSSTFWFDFHHTNGYLGASLQNGFAAPLLLQIAQELQARLPGIFGGHPLTQLWAFKYDSERQGIKLHADLAAVNLNFWITPDDANLDPESGGLVVWDKEAPLDWGFDEYNASSAAGQARIEAYLRDSEANCIRVPHRQNRAVLFNSDLFHATDTIRFKPGYENRRINITMLFGWRDIPVVGS